MPFFPITLVLFSYFIHKLCVEKEVSPWGYLGGFVAGFILIMLAAFAGCLFFFGPHLMNDPDAQKKLESMTPFAMMFQFLLFVFLRRRIERLPFPGEDDDNNVPPSGGGREGKDFSYFR